MGWFSRRVFLRSFLATAFLPLLPQVHRALLSPGLLAAGKSGDSPGTDIASRFLGEELHYRIGFLWIDEAATGRISFEKAKGDQGYKATLEGQTSGLIGWLTGYRRDSYMSSMELIDGGKRLKPLWFEEDVVIGDKVRKKITRFDYQRGRLVKRRMNRRGVFIRSEEKIPEGVVYDDFLTAFYNFRCGVYGEIRRGKRYRVRTIPKGGISTIDVEIATKEEEMRRCGKGKRGEREYCVTVFLDKELTRSKTGRVEGWASRSLVPLEGIIEDVVMVGDVHGVLIGKGESG
jgi:hypothetical protein